MNKFYNLAYGITYSLGENLTAVQLPYEPELQYMILVPDGDIGYVKPFAIVQGFPEDALMNMVPLQLCLDPEQCTISDRKVHCHGYQFRFGICGLVPVLS